MKKISVNSIITEYLDSTGYSGRLDKSRLKKWAHTQAERLAFPDQMIYKIVLKDVTSNRAEKPQDIKYITQVAFKGDRSENYVKNEEIVEWVQKTYNGTGCEYKISLECPPCVDPNSCAGPEIVIDVDELTRRAHPEWFYQTMPHFYRAGGLGKGGYVSSLHPQFNIIGVSDRSSFDNIEMHVKGCLNLREELGCINCTKYTLEENTIYVNEESGQLLISYLALDLDEEGYMKIPDIPEAVDAITWFLEEKMSYLAWKTSRDRADFMDYENAKQRKEISMGEARSKINTQEFPDFMRDLNKFYGKVLPYADSCGNVVDMYQITMDRLNAK